MTNIDPKFELFAESTNDIPAIVDRVRHAGRLRGRSARSRPAASWVRWSDAESGSWTLTISRPWSCCGMNPVGARPKTTVRQAEQAAVGEQDDEARPHSQPTDHA